MVRRGPSRCSGECRDPPSFEASTAGRQVSPLGQSLEIPHDLLGRLVRGVSFDPDPSRAPLDHAVGPRSTISTTVDLSLSRRVTPTTLPMGSVGWPATRWSGAIRSPLAPLLPSTVSP